MKQQKKKAPKMSRRNHLPSPQRKENFICNVYPSHVSSNRIRQAQRFNQDPNLSLQFERSDRAYQRIAHRFIPSSYDFHARELMNFDRQFRIESYSPPKFTSRVHSIEAQDEILSERCMDRRRKFAHGPSSSHVNWLKSADSLYNISPDGQVLEMSKRRRIDSQRLVHVNYAQHLTESRSNDYNGKVRAKKKKTTPKQKTEDLDAASILCSISKTKKTNNRDEQQTETARRFQIPACVSLEELVPDKTKLYSRSDSSDLDCATQRSKCPTRLSTSGDPKELNSLHCYVRSELLELFEQHDCSSETKQSDGVIQCEEVLKRPKSQDSSRVGLRCVFCALKPKPALIYDDKKNPFLDPQPIIDSFNAPMSTFYPKSINEIYRLVCTWQRVHFNKCKNVPPSVKAMYKNLKASDKTRGKTKYWTTSANDLGLVDDNRNGGFLRYAPKE